MGWFKSKKQQQVILPSAGEGFFNNGAMIARPEDRRPALVEMMKLSFQRDIGALVPIGADGAVLKDANGAVATMDHSGTSLSTSTSMVNGFNFVPTAQLSWYATWGFIGYQICAMYSQHWLIDKACSMPAKDAVRNGYDVTVNDGTDVGPDVLDEIRHLDKRHNIPQECINFLRFGNIFGIRIAIFKVHSTDPDYYEKPFNPDGITPGSYKGISQVDPYWITPELDAAAAADPSSMHFYEPTWWRVNGKRYHRTHLIIMRNGEVPDVLKPTYLYGGIPVPQKIAERVYGAERTANEAPLLAMTKRLTVMNLDVEKALANLPQFECKMNTWTTLMNNFGVKIIGGKETIEQYDTSLADLDAVIMTQYQIVAAAAEVPATKLLGTQPKGFNSTGEFEAKSYAQKLESDQSTHLTPLVERHHLIVIRSNICPKFQIKPFATEVNWRPVDSPTAAELADINLKKSQADKSWSDAGAIDAVDIRGRLINDRDSGYNGIEEAPDGMLDEPDDKEVISEDGAEFSPLTGQLADAYLVTSQDFLNPDVVEAKRKAGDYAVDVSPVYEAEGKKWRTIIDGHHSLAAAILDKIAPTFREKPMSALRNAVIDGA